MRFALGTVLALVLWLAPSSASAGAASDGPKTRDSYVLSRGHSASVNGSIEQLDALRTRYPGDFLWVRRSGAPYLIRDAKFLEQAAALFDTLRELEPEQDALEHRQEQLSREEESLDREQERLDMESDRLSDDGSDESDESAGEGPYPAIEEQQRDLESRQSDLAARQREVDAIEQDLDRRAEALEQQAEAALWKLIDGAIREGLATPASR